jgi:ABC-type phosphate transport system substrate-binding protein
MKRWHHPLALVALAGAVALAGCGGGSSSSAKTTAPPAATSGSTSSTGASTTGSTSTVPANLKQAVAECHRLIKSDKSLPPTAKEKLENACEEAGKGNTAAVKRAAREVCEEVVSSSPLPANSSARQQALAACKK